MDNMISDLMVFQGEIKVKLMKHLSEKTAHELAGELFHYILIDSEMVKEEIKEAYKNIL